MNNLVELYSTQLRVLRQWRGGRGALFRRLVIVLLVSIIAFFITEWLDPSIQILHPIGALEVVLLMAALNAVVRPVVLAFIAPRSLILTGIAVLVLQILVSSS
jgi:hypothetical protein